ncbi:DUF6545 domain-containing protein [Streptomyces sp. NPDC002586]
MTDALLHAVFLLWAIGATAPAAHGAAARYRAVTSLIALHPLWRDLALTAPDIVRHRASMIPYRIPGSRILNAWRDIFTGADSSLGIRLDRFVSDIRDAIDELRRHAPSDLAEHALNLASAPRAQRAGGSNDEPAAQDVEIQAEAYWIRAARETVGPQPGPLVPYPFPTGTDLRTEVPHLRKLATAYRHVENNATRQLLDWAWNLAPCR